MYSPKYVDYVDKKRIESAFYNPKSKPKTWVGMIAEARKALKYKAFVDFDAIKIAFWREFDATYFQRKQKCSDETNRQSIFAWNRMSFINLKQFHI